MKRFSKIFSIFLTMVMILTSMPTNVFASNITRITDTIIENNYIDDGNVVNNNLEDDLVVIREDSTQYGKIYHVLHKSQLQNKNLWDVADVVMAGISWAEFLGDPSLKNFAWATLDTVAIVPFLPSTAYFRQGGKTIIKAKELAKFAKTSKGKTVLKGALKTFKYSDAITGKAITKIRKTFKTQKEAEEVISIFKKAANKGLVGSTNESGIKKLSGKIKKIYTHEIKVKGKYGQYRIFGYKDSSGRFVFDLFEKAHK